MKRTVQLAMVILALVVNAHADLPAVDHVMGMTDVQYTSGINVWVPMATSEAISGLVWYNNDGTVVFPEILLAAGDEEEPPPLTEMISVAQQVQGGSTQWSTMEFAEPIASATEGLHLTLKFPPGSVQVEAGTGGGAGVGYCIEQGGLKAWTTFDGETWIPVHESLMIAMVPEFVAADESTLRLDATGDKSLSDDEAVEMVPLVTSLLSPSPNPFNPQTKIAFTLKKKGPIKLTVHDLRGRVVRTLASGKFSAGPHVLTWRGQNDRGHQVASGVYLARLHTEQGDHTEQMVLLK